MGVQTGTHAFAIQTVAQDVKMTHVLIGPFVFVRKRLVQSYKNAWLWTSLIETLIIFGTSNNKTFVMLDFANL